MASNDGKFDFSHRLYTVALILVIAFGLSAIGQFLTSWQSITGDYPRTISVEGVGTAYANPDVAIINVGVTSEGDQVASVVEENTQKINNVIFAVKEEGVAEEDIQTTNFDLYPKYRWDEKEGSQMDGYTLTQQVRIKIRDFEKIGSILKKSTDQGANLIGSLSFDVDDVEAVKAMAREDAIEKAKEKARGLQKATGLRFGRLLSVYEYSDYSGKGGYMMAADVAEGGVVAPSIQPGQQEINLTVNLEYQIR